MDRQLHALQSFARHVCGVGSRYIGWFEEINGHVALCVLPLGGYADKPHSVAGIGDMWPIVSVECDHDRPVRRALYDGRGGWHWSGAWRTPADDLEAFKEVL